MKINEKAMEKKRQNKARIASHILHKKQISKPELAAQLGLSMPTVLQNVKELVEAGIVEEVGEYESTGGRKAKALSVVENVKYAVGIDITANHVSYVIINLRGDVVESRRTRRRYENTSEYYEGVAADFEQFMKESREGGKTDSSITDSSTTDSSTTDSSKARPIQREKILGVGISLPGIIDRENSRLVRSHILQVSDINLEVLSRLIPYPVHFENDANSAAIAELKGTEKNAVYLSLSNTVGGSIYLDNAIYGGDHFRSAEFGHMVIHPGGRLCYCGKKGCADAYCSAGVLSSFAGEEAGLADFFHLLEQKDKEALLIWDAYLEDLAIVITNLRMSFDCDIVLGGYVGGYLKPYLSELGRKVIPYNKFDNDALYIRSCTYDRDASAVGIAMTFLEEYFTALI